MENENVLPENIDNGSENTKGVETDKVTDLKGISFSNSGDIESFFKKYNTGGFIEWFNSKNSRFIKGGKPLNPIKRSNSHNWKMFWNQIPTLFGKDSINLAEFFTLTNIVCIETGSTFAPVTERVGSSGSPGLAYAFDRIDWKKSYNGTDIGNIQAYDLFNDHEYISAHGNRGMSNLLKNTTDIRWKGEKFPLGFSGNSSKETSTKGDTNGFLYEADFMKFRGRGFVQSTGRPKYNVLVDFIKSYRGSNETINSFKTKWSNLPNKRILTQSTNSDWDKIFNNTDAIVPCFAVYEFSKSRKNLYHIDITNDETISKDTYNAGWRTNGGTKYGKDVSSIVNIQLSELSIVPDNPVDSPSSQSMGSSDSSRNSTNDSNIEYPSDLPKVEGLSNFFRPEIKIDPIKFDIPTDSDQKKEVANTIGFQPFVWYISTQIRDIKSLILSSRGLLPTMKLVFTDSEDIMTDDGFPLDDARIKIFLNSRTPSLRPIFMEFKIVNFSRNGSTYTIDGICSINKFFLREFESYQNMSSFECLQEFARRAELGFNSNVTESDDQMNWINIGKRGSEFIKEIVSSSYRSDESFIWCYVDFYYNLNYIDIEEALKVDIKNQSQIKNTGIETLNGVTDGEEETNPLWLSNDASLDQTNQYFTEWKIINNSTSISLQNGYLNKAKFYNINSKDYLIFDIDSITTEGDKTIIMKGSPQDMEFYNNHIRPTYVGKLDTDNMHDNFNYSIVQNEQNIKDLQKIGMSIKMKTPNYNLYRYQKVSLVFSGDISTPSTSQVNNRLTGDWLIIDIDFISVNGEFNQKITLVRRELSLSSDELSKEKNQESKKENGVDDNGERSENPIDTSGDQIEVAEDNELMPFDYDLRFTNANEIDDFFDQYHTDGFVGWFNKEFSNNPIFTDNVQPYIPESHGGGVEVGTADGEGLQPKINKTNWIKVWNSTLDLVYNDNRGQFKVGKKKNESTPVPVSNYEYILKTQGNSNWIVVEKDGDVIYSGDKSDTIDSSQLQTNAYITLVGDYPDIPMSNENNSNDQLKTYSYSYETRHTGDAILVIVTVNSNEGYESSDLKPFTKKFATTFTESSALDSVVFNMENFGDFVNGESYPKDGTIDVKKTMVESVEEKSEPSNKKEELELKKDFNIVEFLVLNTMIIYLSGSNFTPIEDGRPIIDIFESNNKLDGNETTYSLFNNDEYVTMNENKTFSDILKNTTDVRWDDNKFPIGFSGTQSGPAKEVLKEHNEFITNADFYKFRQRGLIKFMGRHDYGVLINFITSYNGENEVILSYKEKWSGESEIENIINKSTDDDWDKLINESDLLIPTVGMGNVLWDLKQVHIFETEGKNEDKIFRAIENFGKLVESSLGNPPPNFVENYIKMVRTQIDFLNSKELIPAPKREVIPPGKYELDLIPGEYVDNSGNKIKLCQIDGSAVNVKVAEAYYTMRDAAKEAGLNLKINSGFRSPYDTIDTKSEGGKLVKASSQNYLYEGYKSGKPGFNLAAKPGNSQHGNGIGFDLNVGGSSKGRFKNVNRKMYEWLVKNSWKYGFVRSVRSEEWHYDYLPHLIEKKKNPYARIDGTDGNKFYSDWGLDKLS